MFLPIELTEAEYKAMAEEDDGKDPSDPDDDEDGYDHEPSHDSHGRTFW